jgi:hypothetical protein
MNNYSITSSVECHASSSNIQNTTHKLQDPVGSDVTSTENGPTCHLNSGEVDHEDMSPWQYARYHGLCRDFFVDDPISSLSDLLLLESDMSEQDQDVNHAYIPAEKLLIEKEAATILKSTICLPLLEDENLSRSPKQTKLELPLLQYDHEIDMLRFLKQSCFNLDAMIHYVVDVDQEKDTGLDWPSSMLNLPSVEEQRILSEKLVVPRETLAYLKELHDVWAIGDVEVTDSDKSSCKNVSIVSSDFSTANFIKKPYIKPLTPPLSPALMNMSACGGESPDISLQLMSEETDPDVELLQQIETQMATEDIIKPLHLSKESNYDGLDIDAIYPELGSIVASSSYVPEAKFQNLRVEEPLSPPIESHGNDVFEITTLANELGNEASSLQKWKLASEGQSSETDTEAFNVLRPLAEYATDAINQERLTEAGAIMRVEVPVIHFPTIFAPWNVNSGVQQPLLQQVKNDLGMFSSWPGISKLELSLPWRPFPNKLAEVVFEEKIDELDYLGRILEYMTLEDVGTSDSLVWKQQGLRILDDLEDDGDLELGKFQEEERGVEFLVKKRKLEQTTGNIDTPSIPRQMPTGPGGISVFQQDLSISTLQKRQKTNQDTIKPSTSFSNKEALDMFLMLKGLQAQPLVSAPTTTKETSSKVSRSQDPRRPQRSKEVPEPVNKSVEEFQQDHEYLSIELPKLPSELPQRFAIVSSEILQRRRSLYRRMTHMYPNCEFIERDFSVLQSDDGLLDLKSSIEKIPRYDPCLEADLIISPSTGVLLTTVQKIQQRSLPGQGTQQNTFNSRLCQVSIRYERLIVLVSQGVDEHLEGTMNTTALPNIPDISHMAGNVSSTSSTAPVTPRDTLALASLQSFAATRSTNVNVQFVLGGENNLAAWIAFHIHVSGTAMLHIQAEESFWEHVLRRVGLNCFAAGLILTVLAKPTGNEDGNTSELRCSRIDYGIAAFFSMSSDERFLQFEKLLGGRKVLKRVNACLERGWISESTGFKRVITHSHPGNKQ